MRRWLIALVTILTFCGTPVSAQTDPEVEQLILEQEKKFKEIESAQQEVRAISKKIKDKVTLTVTRIGPFNDRSVRDLRNVLYSGPNNTVENCAQLAKAKALPFFGLQYGIECRGDTRYGTYGPAPDSTVLMPCSGNASQTCGAGWVNEVYALGTYTPPPPDTKIDTEPELTAALLIGGEVKCEGTISGNFTFSKPTQLVGAVQPLGVRATPTDSTPCVLSPLDVTSPVVSIPTFSASGSSIVGVYFNGGNTDSTTLMIGTLSATEAVLQPSDITIRSNVFMAGSNGGLRGISAHGSNIVIEDNHIENYWNANRDTQGIWGNNGPGPYRIVNNFIEASGENIMFGGDAARIVGVVPSDILVKSNTLFKRQAWRTAVPNPSVKNLFELKNAQRVVVEDNIMDGNWRDSQEGSAILFTVRNEGADSLGRVRMPWATVNEVTFRRNTVINTPDAFAVNILGLDDNGLPSVQSKRIIIEGNLFRDSPNGVRINRGVTEELSITRNTFSSVAGNLLYFTQFPKTALRFELNVVKSGAYGINGDALTGGQTALQQYVTLLGGNGNVIETSIPAWRWAPLSGTTFVTPGGLASLLDSEYRYVPGGAGW